MCEGFMYNFAFRTNDYKFGAWRWIEKIWYTHNHNFSYSSVHMIYFFSHYWNGNAIVKLAFYYLQVTKNFLLLINIFQMKYLQNDLITPLERLAESDVLYVKVHSRKKCMFVKCERLVIISKLWRHYLVMCVMVK